jgi:hypothetical protein
LPPCHLQPARAGAGSARYRVCLSNHSFIAMRARCKPDDQQPRSRIAKSRHGAAPIFPIAISSFFLAPDGFPIFAKPRAANASNQALIDLI